MQTGQQLGRQSRELPLEFHVCKRRRLHAQTQRPQTVAAGRGGGQSGGERRGPRTYKKSDGTEHLGTAIATRRRHKFPGPPPDEGPPLRVLPIGGLGEIGMNCMLVGVRDRYILIDAGLMFPDFSDLGMQKILPDTGALAAWKDKIEALIITHAHEDHIGALPWVLPALDPKTPVYASGFPMQLIKRRLQEYGLWDASRMHTFRMRDRFQLGPFECEPIRVTHSIPDCCGLILRSDEGNIVHTGDWKIDESPIDGQTFDRTVFEQIGKEGVALMMSDSTNVLTPGRTKSEQGVRSLLGHKVEGHNNKGRVIATMFASNLHRIGSAKAAADAAGRKLCFIGMSLETYLEAAHKEGIAPFNPRELISVAQMHESNPDEVMLVTTGSQGEDRAQLTLAARQASRQFKLKESDLVLYSAKIIPGNDNKVMTMMNSISGLGAKACMDRGLHTSGHAYRDELEEVLQIVKPQHFLPVHGEYAFLTEHAELAQEAGIRSTSVIRNGQMLGVASRRNGKTLSTGSMAHLGTASLQLLYNDGNNGTGNGSEMALDERTTLAMDGIVIVAVDVFRPTSVMVQATGREMANNRGQQLMGKVRITTRGMWVDEGRMLAQLHKMSEAAVAALPPESTLAAVEERVGREIRRGCRQYNQKTPEVIVIAHEYDARAGVAAHAASVRKADAQAARSQGAQPKGSSRTPSKADQKLGPEAQLLPQQVLAEREMANPRSKPRAGSNTEYP